MSIWVSSLVRLGIFPPGLPPSVSDHDGLERRHAPGTNAVTCFLTMRPSKTFTISLPADLAEEVDRIAAAEQRSRSELLREAFRRYVAGQRRWERIFAYGERAAKEAGLASEAAVDAAVNSAVRDVRRQRRQTSQR